MQYRTAYQITDIQFDNLFLCLIFVVLAVSGLRPIYRRLRYRNADPLLASRQPLFSAIATLCVVGYFAFSMLLPVLQRTQEARGQFLAGRCQTVAGKVTNFHAGSLGGPESRIERFTVNGVTFAYTSATSDPGFGRIAELGGPIREGLEVRICYRDGRILKLEIAQP